MKRYNKTKWLSVLKSYLEEYIFVLWPIAIMLLLYQVCRLSFFFYNKDIVGEIPADRLLYMMLGGLKFDLAGLMYVNLIFLLLYIIPFKFRKYPLYRKVAKYIFIIFNAIGLAANCINLVYFRFTMRQTTATVFQEFENETQMGGLFVKMILDYWPIFLLWLAMVATMILLYKLPKRLVEKRVNNWIYYPVNVILFLLFVAGIMAGIRGGLKHSTRPITLSNAAKYTKRPAEMTIVLNTPFSIIRTLSKPTLELKTYFEIEEAEKLAPVVHLGTGEPMPNKPNIVIFILESFSKDLSGVLNTDINEGNYKGYMPFLDSLMENGKSFKHGIANGKKSIDAIPSILCGIPNFGTNYVLSHYVNDSIKGLPTLLEEEGYYSAFFHGAPNGSMGLDAIAKLAGFSDYYGMDEYNNDVDFDGYWGIWDHLFLDFTINQIKTFDEPFLTSVFTLSSHHPFLLPHGFDDKFEEGPIPLDKATRYTDYSLQQFFEKAKNMPWFKNTVFVFTADHSAQVNHIEYKNVLGSYSIPVVFYYPGNSDFNGGIDTLNVVQQIDIMPTLLSFLNYPNDYFAFGKNIFNQQNQNYAWYYSGSWNLITNKYLYQFNGSKSIGLYEHKKDRLLQNNLVEKSTEIADSLSQITKAHLQVYNYRIVTNQLVPKHSFNESKIPTGQEQRGIKERIISFPVASPARY